MALAVADAYEQKAKQLDKQTNRTNLGEMGQKLLAGEIRSLQKWAIKCRSRSTIDSMIALAQRDERFVISASELDRDPDLLGVENGVVHLPSGTLRPENKGDFILRRSPVPFDCSASTFSIERFVQEITALPGGIENGKLTFHPRPELSHYVQKLCGYCLTARTQEQVMFILCGKGANGKSVLVDLLKEVSGEYCEVIPPEVLLATKGVAGAEQANPSTRKLAGARCAITSESNEGASLDVAVVKRHTGDARMTARALYQNPTTFDITHKLVLLTNHPPRVEKMDDAVRGRLQVVPFDMRWNRPGTVAYDPTLPDANKSLLAEFNRDLRGVLKFFVDGAKAYYDEG
jgi:putative DNA primase/helicase